MDSETKWNHILLHAIDACFTILYAKMKLNYLITTY